MPPLDLWTRSDALLSAVLDALPELVFVFDRAGHYLEVLGGKDTGRYHDARSLVGRSVHEVLPEEIAAAFLERIDEALRTQTVVAFEYQLDRRDVDGIAARDGVPDLLWFEGRVAPLPPIEGRDDLVVWMAFNVTASRVALLELQHHRRELERLARTDSLTGLLNHRTFFERAEHELHWTRRTGEPSAMLLLDIHRFKRVNDTYGHAVGDTVLRAVAQLLQTERRATDVIGRLGGEEFGLMVRGADVAHGRRLAERLRSELASTEIPTDQGVLRVTGSFGVTEVLPQDRTPEDAFMRADRAMYAAKRMGRNRVVAEAGA